MIVGFHLVYHSGDSLEIKEIKMEVVNEATVLVVGKYYNVRCAHIKNDESRIDYYTPIYGNIHADAQFGVTEKHYHIDGRFCGREQSKQYDIDKNGFTNNIVSASHNHHKLYEIVIRRMKCKRLTTGIIPPHNKTYWNRYEYKQVPEKYWVWYDKMIGKSCKGKKCPHLGTLMKEKDGVLVCPLHNLNGCIEK